MIETNKDIVNTKFQKKIIGFLDGSLSPEDKSEFEAYVRTNPEFETQIHKKEEELSFLKNLIPAVLMTKETAESLENEMKLSISTGEILLPPTISVARKMITGWYTAKEGYIAADLIGGEAWRP